MASAKPTSSVSPTTWLPKFISSPTDILVLEVRMQCHLVTNESVSPAEAFPAFGAGERSLSWVCEGVTCDFALAWIEVPTDSAEPNLHHVSCVSAPHIVRIRSNRLQQDVPPIQDVQGVQFWRQP